MMMMMPSCAWKMKAVRLVLPPNHPLHQGKHRSNRVTAYELCRSQLDLRRSHSLPNAPTLDRSTTSCILELVIRSPICLVPQRCNPYFRHQSWPVGCNAVDGP